MPAKKSAAPLQLPLAAAPPRLFVGTSGWAYPTWKPGFYPATTRTKDFLPYYASQLNSVEVNHTFRKLPTPAQVESWLAQTPPNFRFSFKAPQRITHFSRLKDCHDHVATFLTALAPAAAAGKLGCILFQLPPNFKADHARLQAFLAAPAFHNPSAPPISFEFRHPTWFCPETNALLAAHPAAVCIAESELLTTPDIHTAPAHTAFRLRHPGGYKPREITTLLARILPLTATRDVYVYFKHEDEPTGALNARTFLRCALKS